MKAQLIALILTRPAYANAEFAEQLEGFEIIDSPLLEIVPTGTTPTLQDAKGVIFTSANGVRFAGPAQNIPAFCVGQATTSQAQDAGWQATYIAENSDGLVEKLGSLTPRIPLLHIGGVHRRGDIADRLTQQGITTSTCDVYDQKLCNLTESAVKALQGDQPVIVPLFSPRTARQFAIQQNPIAPLHLVAISDAVMEETRHLPALTRTVAKQPDAPHMRDAIAEVARRVEAKRAPQ